MAVKIVLKYRPEEILESGTGASTLVLAVAVQKLQVSDANYRGRITSMESVDAWLEIARQNLPEKYRSTAELVHGTREKFEMGFFRGYIHANIPKRNYAFVLQDAPNYADEHGL